jgi:O-Antigen ligase
VSTLARQRVSPRTIVLCASGLLALIASTGVIEDKAFAQPTTLKYALTVAAPLIVFLAAWMEEPLHLFVALTIVAAPLTGATASLGQIRVSLLIPLLFADLGLIALSPPTRRRGTRLRWVGVAAFPLLLLPIATSSHSKPFAVSLGLLLVMAFVVSQVARDEKGLRVVMGAIVAQGILQALVAIWNADTGHILNLYSSAGSTQYATNYIYNFGGLIRPAGTLPDPISLANVLVIGIPISVALLFAIRDSWARAGLLLGLCVVVAALVLALDRASWIGAIAGLATAILIFPKAIRRPAAARVATGIIAAGVLAVVIGGSATTAKFESIFAPTKTAGVTQQEKNIAEGEQTRLDFWRIAITDGFGDHPVAGVGAGNASELVLDHSSRQNAGLNVSNGQFANLASTYLQLIAEGGIGALVLLILLCSGLAADLCYAVRVDRLLVAGLAGSTVALLVCWVTDVVVYYEPVAACEGALFGVIAGVAARSRHAAARHS